MQEFNDVFSSFLNHFTSCYVFWFNVCVLKGLHISCLNTSFIKMFFIFIFFNFNMAKFATNIYVCPEEKYGVLL